MICTVSQIQDAGITGIAVRVVSFPLDWINPWKLKLKLTAYYVESMCPWEYPVARLCLAHFFKFTLIVSVVVSF